MCGYLSEANGFGDIRFPRVLMVNRNILESLIQLLETVVKRYPICRLI